ncbi:hypothetical protein ACS0TY_030763 [Phlomoides rotata]
MRKKLISNSYDMKISSVHNEKNTRIKHNINDRGKRTQLSNKYLIPSTQNQFDSLREEGDYEFLGELVESPSVPVRCSPQKLSWAEMVEDETTLALSSYAPGCNKEGARVPTDSVFKTDKRKVPIASDYNLRSKPQHRPLGNDLPTYAAALVATSTMALELDLSCWALEAEFDLSSFRGSVIKGVKLKAKTQNDPVICRFPVAQSSLLPQHRIPPLSLFPLTTTHVIFLPTRSTATPPIAAASHLQQHPLFLLTVFAAVHPPPPPPQSPLIQRRLKSRRRRPHPQSDRASLPPLFARAITASSHASTPSLVYSVDIYFGHCLFWASIFTLHYWLHAVPP